jgi:hypothetical protein
MTTTNTPAYYDTELIVTVKKFQIIGLLVSKSIPITFNFGFAHAQRTYAASNCLFFKIVFISIFRSKTFFGQIFCQKLMKLFHLKFLKRKSV